MEIKRRKGLSIFTAADVLGWGIRVICADSNLNKNHCYKRMKFIKYRSNQ